MYKWVARQRGERSSFLTPDRRALLDAIQFEWDCPRDSNLEVQWEINFKNLKKHMNETDRHGKLQTVEKGLETWISNQRKRYHRGMLREDRQERLASIGFQFGEARKPRPQQVGKAREEKWEQMYQRLLDFKRKHGHTQVPHSYEDKSLVLWVTTQRREYNQKSWYGTNRSMREDRKKRLEEIGFVWEAFVRQENPRSTDVRQENPRRTDVGMAVENRTMLTSNKEQPEEVINSIAV